MFDLPRGLLMSFLPQSGRIEPHEKLAVVLGQVARLRARLNSLVWQRAIFSSAALLLGAGALATIAAYDLTAGWFLGTVALLTVACAVIIPVECARALHSRVRSAEAARIADERAGLKGRVGTVVALAGRAHRYPLWSYVLEDTLSRRGEFTPAAVERRRLSRAIYALAAILPLVVVATWVALRPRTIRLATGGPAGELTVPLQDLQIRPADSGFAGQSVEAAADPATMAKLLEKAAQAGIPSNESGLSKLVDRARDLASQLQDKITRRPPERAPRIKLRLAEELNEKQTGSENEQARNAEKPEGPKGGQFDEPQPVPKGHEKLPPVEAAPEKENQLAAEGGPGSNRPEGARNRTTGRGELGGQDPTTGPGDQQPGGGTLGSVGADPEHLFGEPDAPPGASDSFGIMINAHPSDRGAARGDRPYVPPKVRASLSQHQYPDEPLARSAVPPEERETIKRIFER